MTSSISTLLNLPSLIMGMTTTSPVNFASIVPPVTSCTTRSLQGQPFDYRCHVTGCQQPPARAAGDFQVLHGDIRRIEQLERCLLPGAVNDG